MNARGDQAVSQRLITIHRDLRPPVGLGNVFKSILMCQHLTDRIGIASLERHQRRVDDAFVFAGKFFANYLFQLLHIETENLRNETKNENIFAFILGGAAKRFHR